MKNIKSKLLTFGLLVAMVVFTVSGIVINKAFASLGVSVTPATGGTSISIDTSATASSPSWTTITGMKITEASVGDISTGIHTLTLPTGWEFNTSQTVTISLNGTELTLGSSNLTPDATQLSFNVVASSTSHTATLTFSGIQVQPSDGVVRASAPILHSGASLNGVNDAIQSFGNLSTVAGSIDHLVVTPADSTTDADTSVTYTATGKDQFDNTTGDVTGATTFSIVGGGDGGSFTDATYTPHTVGTYTVNGNDGGKTGETSLTVTPGAATKIGLTAYPESLVAGSDSILTAAVQDQYGNTVTSDNTTLISFLSDGHATWSPHGVVATSGISTSTLSDLSPETVNISALSTYQVLTPPSDVSVTFTSTGVRVTPPVVTAFTANPVGTSTATLSVTTDENATCAYSNTTKSYASSTVMTVTGGVTSHSQNLTGLIPGTGYVYYVRCQDAYGNTMGSSDSVSFTTAAVQTPASLAINSVVAVPHETVLPDDSYDHGYEWVMGITLPSGQSRMALQFADWTNSLAAGGNMEYYSEEIASSSTGGLNHPISIDAANTYPSLIQITGDNSSNPGIQTNIHILLKIPSSTPAGSHSTTFMLESTSTFD